MKDNDPSPSDAAPAPRAWNKGKIIFPRPLRTGHVWSIRARLHLARRLRDLALFNLAMDSKLRGCDVVPGGPCPGPQSAACTARFADGTRLTR